MPVKILIRKIRKGIGDRIHKRITRSKAAVKFKLFVKAKRFLFGGTQQPENTEHRRAVVFISLPAVFRQKIRNKRIAARPEADDKTDLFHHELGKGIVYHFREEHRHL